MKRFILSLALLAPFTTFAQSHHEIGLSAGVANYYGDLQDKMFPNYGYRPMAGVAYKYFFNPRVGVRFGAAFSSVTAADSLSEIQVKQERNLRFASNLFEVHGGFELNLLQVESDRAKVSPYIFAGLSLFHFNPYTDGARGEKVYLRALGTEGQGIPVYPDRKEYKTVNIAFPIGGGLKFFVGKTFFITTELGFRYTNTDYLDDVRKKYVNLDTLRDYKGQQAVDLSFRSDEKGDWWQKKQEGNQDYPNFKFQRGDSKANDWYWFGNVTVTVYLKSFGNVKKYWQANCPAFR